MKEIYGVFGDIGGCREGFPALQLLEKQGMAIKYFVDSIPQTKAGTEVLAKAGIPYEIRDPQPEDNPKVIVIGTSATAVGAQIRWTEFGKQKGVPVIWVEDFWGTGELFKTRSVSPDVTCTLDEVAVKVGQGIRPDIKFEIVGKPSFENLAKYVPIFSETVLCIRKQIAERSGAAKDSFIVTFWGGGESPERVRMHLEAMQGMDDEVVFAPRLHPKFPPEAKEEFKKLAWTGNKIVVDTHDINPDELTIASSLNIGDWGSTNMYTSALFSIPAIMCLFPDDKKERVAIGYPDGVPPLLIAEAGWGPENSAQFKEIIGWIISNEQEARKRVQKNAEVFKSLLEPGATKRITEIIGGYC